jgi:AmmeMemoRadiSam system protein B/AmmeMemoRadiSam system protein A
MQALKSRSVGCVAADVRRRFDGRSAARIFLTFFVFGLGCRSTSPAGARTDQVRSPAVAGQFYSVVAKTLGAGIDAYMKDAVAAVDGRPIALVLPHAGYVFSGQICADGYRSAQGHDYDLVVLLGTNHTAPGLRRVAIYPGRGFSTLLGTAAIDGAFVDRLVAECGRDCELDTAAHAREHSVEVQIPFVQRVLPGVKIVPVIVGEPDVGLCRRFGEALARAISDRRVLIVASSDLSHYPDAKDAERVDRATLESIARLDPDAIRATLAAALRQGVANLSTAACGEAPILAAVYAAKALGAKSGKILSYAHSGQIAVGERNRVVGYGAVALTAESPARNAPAKSATVESASEAPLEPAERRELLDLARETITRLLLTETAPLPRGYSDRLMREQGAFVTLKKKGDLRGCIGRILPDGPLAELVSRMAFEAAFRDPRFQPLAPSELSDIEIEVSLLTPPRRVSGASGVVVGRDGVILGKSGHSAVFLPQVAPEQGWDRDTMLDALCRKAGLTAGCWKDAELSVFQAEVFHEGKS